MTVPLKDLFISVIVPCCNEAQVIPALYERLKKASAGGGIDRHEIIFIDDGSSDNTLQLLRQLAQSDAAVRVISFSKNFGQQSALSAGLRCCRGDAAVIIDADLQDPPEAIPGMIDLLLREKANVVYGVRQCREGETLLKKMTSKMFIQAVNWFADVSLPSDTGDFRLVDRNVINAFNKLQEKNKYIRGLLSWVGFKQVPFFYTRGARFAGKTKYSLKKMLRLALRALFSFSRRPLQITIAVGALATLTGMGLGMWIVAVKLLGIHDRTIPGWASIVIVTIFLGGVQLLSIGILSQYIQSILDEVQGRPEYIIAEEINAEHDDAM